MTHTRRTFLAVAGAGMLGLAGCGGDGDSGTAAPGTDGPTTPGDDETPTQAATLQVRDHPDYGEILVDGDGMTLYMFDNDTQGAGASTCSGGCAQNWPPLTTDGPPAVGDGVDADVTTFERSDGSTQVALDGWPLYYWQADESPGDATGQGVTDVWWVLGPDGTPKRPQSTTIQVRDHPDYGEILVDGDGMTLYMFDNDTQGETASACSGGCTVSWPPLTTETAPAAGEGVSAESTTFERSDGSMQVTADGWPLYHFGQDEEPGDATGQGANDVWWVLGPDGTPRRSTDVGESDGGDGGSPETDDSSGGGGYGY